MIGCENAFSQQTQCLPIIPFEGACAGELEELAHAEGERSASGDICGVVG